MGEGSLQEMEEDRSSACDDRVFSSRYVYKLKRSVMITSFRVYKLKRSAVTGEVYRFKVRLIVRGFQMEKGINYEDSFSPTTGMAVGRFMLSLAVVNDYELHACDIEQAFSAFYLDTVRSHRPVLHPTPSW